MKNWMQQRREEDAEAATPGFERNSRASASTVSERKRKKKRFLTPTRDQSAGHSKFYDSDEGPAVEKQAKLADGEERMSRREIWVSGLITAAAHTLEYSRFNII